jgi:DNA-directed RNA polymerase specialized sigma24 family protein
MAIVRLSTVERNELAAERALGLSYRRIAGRYEITEDEARELVRRGWVKAVRPWDRGD